MKKLNPKFAKFLLTNVTILSYCRWWWWRRGRRFRGWWASKTILKAQRKKKSKRSWRWIKFWWSFLSSSAPCSEVIFVKSRATDCTVGCSIISPLLIFVMRIHFSDGNLDADYEFDIFWLWRHFEFARCTFDVIFCYFSLSRELFALESWVLHQTMQNIWFPICLQHIM